MMIFRVLKVGLRFIYYRISDLKFLPNHDNPLNKGGDYMKGSYHYDLNAKRYFVKIYPYARIWRYNGEPIWHEKTADKLLNKIRAEIDDGTFNIKAYLPDSPLSLQSYSELWLKSSDVCKATKKMYRTCIRRAIQYFGENCDIRYIVYSKLKLFCQELPLTNKGKYHTLNTLKSMLKCAVKDGILKRLPEFPSLQNENESDVEYLTYDEQKNVLESIVERHRSIFAFAMEFGLRIGEARALKKDAIEDTHLIVKRSFSEWELRETTKTKRIRRLPLTTRAREILKNAPPSFSDYLFTFDGRKPYYERKMRELWKDACEKVGIKIHQKNAIRHSLGCQLLDDGVDLEMVRDIYGHTSTDMTRKYIKRTPRRMLEALEKRGKIIQFTESLPNENNK
jgi:integrase